MGRILILLKKARGVHVCLLHLELPLIQAEVDVGHDDLQIVRKFGFLDLEKFLLMPDLDQNSDDSDAEAQMIISQTACHRQLVQRFVIIYRVIENVVIHLILIVHNQVVDGHAVAVRALLRIGIALGIIRVACLILTVHCEDILHCYFVVDVVIDLGGCQL